MRSVFAPAILALGLLLAPQRGSAQERDASAHQDGPHAGEIARGIERAALRALHVMARHVGDREASACLDTRISQLVAVYQQAVHRSDRARNAESTGDAATIARETAALARLAHRSRIVERRVLDCVGEEREVAADWTETEVEWVGGEDERVARRDAH